MRACVECKKETKNKREQERKTKKNNDTSPLPLLLHHAFKCADDLELLLVKAPGLLSALPSSTP